MMNLLELKNKIEKLVEEAESLDVEVLIDDVNGWYGIEDVCINKYGDVVIKME